MVEMEQRAKVMDLIMDCLGNHMQHAFRECTANYVQARTHMHTYVISMRQTVRGQQVQRAEALHTCAHSSLSTPRRT